MFLQKVSSPVLTSCQIKGEVGNSTKLALVDSLTEEVVKSGSEAAEEVEILVLKGDYAGHEAFNGKSEDFNNRIVSKMEGKTSVLQGTTTLKLKEGISSIGHLSVTQNSGWTRILKLCLGARAVNSFPGTTIQPTETESFDLKNNRVTAYAKKEVPSLLDKVSALKHIGRGITKRLNNGSINTVKDLLVVLNTNPQRLQEVKGLKNKKGDILHFVIEIVYVFMINVLLFFPFSSKRSIINAAFVGTKTWEEVTDHAKTCIIDDKAIQVYFDPDSQQKCGAVFDVIGQVKRSLKESRYFPMNMLSDVIGQEKVWTYKDVNSLLEEFPQTLASTMTENPNQFISCYSPLFDTWEQPGIASRNIFTSTNCIGESSHLGSPKESLWGPLYSPSYNDEEFLHFMTFNDKPEISSELKPKLSWFIICVSRWLVISKRVGYHVNKKTEDPVTYGQKL
ncbi:hypothetical protein POM88_051071 [Heracleum sosnowskyi]|uniref:Uncharacterized protein n=1 Tax=Heracleum sosnowskyi TaxID=360622 RepID=A0AAD8GYQ0_9APIA|nr:hypothetical protein POM88_051071 [Heracleum sosnowskyi]